MFYTFRVFLPITKYLWFKSSLSASKDKTVECCCCEKILTKKPQKVSSFMCDRP